MFRTLVVGLGRAGAGLHLPVLAKARDLPCATRLFAPAPVVAVDPTPTAGGALEGVVTAPSLEAARALLEPDRTVVHLCTPPRARPEAVEQLAVLGFRNLILEKPLAADLAGSARIDALARRYGLRLSVVGQWLNSALTSRLADLAAGGRLGTLRSISVAQRKPRYDRSLATFGHPTAFDVELPHALAVALLLAGPARFTGARCADLTADGWVLPKLGSAEIDLRHRTGVLTHLASDLGAPVRERRITLGFDGGEAVGHYPVAQDDCHARFTVSERGTAATSVFPDDSLTAFIVETYTRLLIPGQLDPGYALAAETVRLLDEAKRHCGATAADYGR
jgi:predicted dehydrogenase